MNTRLAFSLGFATATWLALTTSTANAQDRVAYRPPPRTSSPCSISLEDALGRPLHTYYTGGQTFVLGEQGDQYSIRVRNRSLERIEAVVTVDGRDVINGGSGDYVRNRGYVVEGRDSVNIKGFRQSLDQVATFRFSSPRHSYAARLGAPQNVGVIGVACFLERRAPTVVHPPVPYHPQYAPERADESAPSLPKSGGAPAPGQGSRGYAPPPQRRHNLGTEYGESRYAPVGTTWFVREQASRPTQLVVVHYDDADGLEARGIPVYWFPTPEPVSFPPPPNPFPDNRFAPPPPR